MRPLHWARGLLAKRRTLGGRGELVAEEHLRGQGYRLLARNLRNRAGEIDLLMEAPDRRTIVVVEVKAGRVGNLPPEVHVDARKQRQLARLAMGVMRKTKRDDRPLRFDVVAVEFDGAAEPVIRHHPGAFHGGW